MTFQGFSVGRNCLRPETVPLTILAIKKRLSCNLAKTFKNCPFYGRKQHGYEIFNYWNSKSSKLSLHSLLINMTKIPILDLKKRGRFFKFCFMFKVPPFYYHKV